MSTVQSAGNSKRVARASCPTRVTGTADTSGQPTDRRTLRTPEGGVTGKSTIEALAITVQRVKLAAARRKSPSGEGAMTTREYADAALTAALRADLAADPTFILPPHLAFKS